MTEEFNLSEKMHDCPELLSEVIREKDVRKFIKKLKEKGKTRYKNPFGKPIYILTEEEINELAGEKLSK